MPQPSAIDRDTIALDVEDRLHAHQHKGLLRFITCGSVDDGKSTLIGRLLYGSQLLFEDQLAALEADSTAQFVRRATEFCNEVVWGSLSMTILADPRTLRDPETGPAIERAVAELRYGSIGVNLWHALSFAFASTVWGAYPGHEATDIQSGRGFVGNAYLFARPQKSVIRGPFVATPRPAWFSTNANAGPRSFAPSVRPSNDAQMYATRRPISASRGRTPCVFTHSSRTSHTSRSTATATGSVLSTAGSGGR